MGERLLCSPVVLAYDRWLLGGGIGSGKSAVRILLAAAGVATIDADAIGHQALNEAVGEVAAAWPQVVHQGVIDRSLLGRVVFSDREQLARLESITHPLIFDRIGRLLEGLPRPVVIEMPLLDPHIEGEWGRIVVDATDANRRHRLRERGIADADIDARLSVQPSRQDWLDVADIVIPNHGSEAELEDAVAKVVPLLGGT